jgi:hypothetical protein
MKEHSFVLRNISLLFSEQTQYTLRLKIIDQFKSSKTKVVKQLRI